MSGNLLIFTADIEKLFDDWGFLLGAIPLIIYIIYMVFIQKRRPSKQQQQTEHDEMLQKYTVQGVLKFSASSTGKTMAVFAVFVLVAMITALFLFFGKEPLFSPDTKTIIIFLVVASFVLLNVIFYFLSLVLRCLELHDDRIVIKDIFYHRVFSIDQIWAVRIQYKFITYPYPPGLRMVFVTRDGRKHNWICGPEYLYSYYWSQIINKIISHVRERVPKARIQESFLYQMQRASYDVFQRPMYRPLFKSKKKKQFKKDT